MTASQNADTGTCPNLANGVCREPCHPDYCEEQPHNADSVGRFKITVWAGDTVKVYREPRDWWVGYYRGDAFHYVCLLPTIVIRWPR